MFTLILILYWLARLPRSFSHLFLNECPKKKRDRAEKRDRGLVLIHNQVS
ncbi:MAG: hypothetical protein ABEI32_07760 [Halothece sp.]